VRRARRHSIHLAKDGPGAGAWPFTSPWPCPSAALPLVPGGRGPATAARLSFRRHPRAGAQRPDPRAHAALALIPLSLMRAERNHGPADPGPTGAFAAGPTSAGDGGDRGGCGAHIVVAFASPWTRPGARAAAVLPHQGRCARQQERRLPFQTCGCRSSPLPAILSRHPRAWAQEGPKGPTGLDPRVHGGWRHRQRLRMRRMGGRVSALGAGPAMTAGEARAPCIAWRLQKGDGGARRGNETAEMPPRRLRRPFLHLSPPLLVVTRGRGPRRARRDRWASTRGSMAPGVIGSTCGCAAWVAGSRRFAPARP
jgi:hypothetical protein